MAQETGSVGKGGVHFMNHKQFSAKGGTAGRGAAKARTSEQARAAAQARWEKQRRIEKEAAKIIETSDYLDHIPQHEKHG